MFIWLNRRFTFRCNLSLNFKSEFSKTEHAQKAPVRIANEGQSTGAVRISTAT